MNGHDAPITAEEDDVLGRSAFAAEIAELAASTPPEWSTRIGVYGEWGTGKTSILRMVAQRLRARGHTVAEFNPWGADSVDEMMKGLLSAVVRAKSAAGDTPPGRARRLISSVIDGLGQASAAGDGVAGAIKGAIVGEVATLAGNTLARLASAIRSDREQVARIAAADSEERLVVLVDDLDRTPPGVVPKLLFALHEVLSELPIVFVLALDPYVVAKALASHHPAFGAGLDFLEKIVQFPRWIPEPSDDELVALAMRDIEQSLPFVNREALRQEMPGLPRNPRRLRQLVRSLWPLRTQAARHADGDLNWNLLIRLALLRQLHPHVVDRLIQHREVIVKIMSSHFSRADKRISDRIQADATALLESLGLRDQVDVMMRVGGELVSAGGGLVGAEVIEYHLSLLTRAPVFTLREVMRMDPQSPGDALWRGTLARTGASGLSDLVCRSAEGYREAMEQAAQAELEDLVNDQLAHARRVLSLVRSATLHGNSSPPMTAELFAILRAAVLQWAHFARTSQYRAAQTEARALLLDLADADTADVAGIVTLLSPWNRDDPPSEAREARRSLDDEVLERLTVRLERQSCAHMLRTGGFLGMHGDAERWALFRVGGWSGTFLEELETAARASSGVQENTLQFLAELAGEGGHSRGVSQSACQAVARHVGLIQRLWAIATLRPVNVRMFRGLVGHRERLMTMSASELSEPPWWNQVAELLRDDEEERQVDRSGSEALDAEVDDN